MSTISFRGPNNTAASRVPGRRTPRPDALRTLARLTGRDQRLLELLAEHRVLATEHVAAWLFPTLDSAQRRLVTLYRLGVLDRFRTPQLDGAITSWRYTLGPHGAAVLAAMRGTTPPRPPVVHRRTLRLAAHPELNHLLGVNHLLSQLAAHSRSQPHPTLSMCWGERRATDSCGALARPDALIVWGPADAPQLVGCLEYDTGTEALHRLVDKLPGYTDLALAGGPRLPALNPDGEHHGGVSHGGVSHSGVSHSGVSHSGEHHGGAGLQLWLLVALPHPRREANLRERLANHHTAQHNAHPAAGATALRMATTTTDHAAALGGAAAEIWLPLHTTTRVSLTDLAATHR